MNAPDTLDLSDIPGLGPVRRTALAEAGIENLQGLLAMKVAQLAAIRGVGIWQARKIQEFLRQRGLSLEVEGPDTEGEGADTSVVVAHARTPGDVEAVAEAVLAIQEQAQREVQVREEVERVVEAIENARQESGVESPGGIIVVGERSASAGADGTVAASTDAAPNGSPAVAEEGSSVDEQEDEQPGAESPDESASDDQQWQEEIRAQRERLPEAALTLMEAIRQAAVAKQLTRQLTRLLITAGEFASTSRPISDAQRGKATEILAGVEQSLQRAVEKQSFRPNDQRDLADRIRKRRKELEAILEDTEE
ncbi:MAG TPA: helix-hairpin-helix domain-containing protein [Armatimonadota bacterium]|nr:helix-hairpin-helix domain-containing protein [Armatimonadota bacterium]